MGVRSATKTLFLITVGVGGKGEDSITSQDLHHVSNKFSSKDETVAIVDCSWIAQKFGRISNDAVGAVMKILLVLKGLGYRVIPVAHSNQKNNAKRIRNEREKIYMKKTVDLKYCRVQLDKLRRELSNTNQTLEERAEIQKVSSILEKSVTSKEKGTFRMDNDFIDTLQDEVLNIFCLGGTEFFNGNNIGNKYPNPHSDNQINKNGQQQYTIHNNTGLFGCFMGAFDKTPIQNINTHFDSNARQHRDRDNGYKSRCAKDSHN